MQGTEYKATAKIWLYSSAKTAWHFITVPKEISDEIRFFIGDFKKGWGSVPVTATIGKTTWKTSIFPDKETHCYFLPLKADVRNAENIGEGDEVSFVIRVGA